MLLVSGASRTVERLKSSRHLGHLTSPRAGNSLDWIASTGLPFAADNGAFTGFDAPAFARMLARLEGRPRLLFVVCPDAVGDAAATLGLFAEWHGELASRGLPVGFVAQDGQEFLPVPWDAFDALFIGGSTPFKLGPIAASLSAEALFRGKHVHLGRVNSLRRLRLAHRWGCHTADGSGYSRFADTHLPGALAHLASLDAQGELFPRAA